MLRGIGKAVAFALMADVHGVDFGLTMVCIRIGRNGQHAADEHRRGKEPAAFQRLDLIALLRFGLVTLHKPSFGVVWSGIEMTARRSRRIVHYFRSARIKTERLSAR